MNIIYMSLFIIAITIFTGCSSKEPEKSLITVFDSCLIEGVDAPKWVCGDATAQNIYQIYDVGSATISKLGAGFTQKEAAAKAEIKLREQLEDLAKDKLVLFIREAEIDISHDIDKDFLSVLSKRVADKVLKKARVSEYWKNYDLNRAYAQLVVKKETFKTVMEREVLLEIRQKVLYWEAFKNRNASGILKKVLSKD